MVLEIASITRETLMQVTTSTPNEWIVGQKAYFSIPFDYGMQQLNAQIAEITSIDPTNTIFTFNLNSSQFDPFGIPSNTFQDATMASYGASNIYNFVQFPVHAINPNIGN